MYNKSLIVMKYGRMATVLLLNTGVKATALETVNQKRMCRLIVYVTRVLSIK